MIDLAKHISYLVAVHDCVIVPGLGAFVCSYRSAGYDPQSGMFKAPRRCVAFNAQLRHNDAMLAQSISRREGVPYVRAAALIEREVDTIRHQIDLQGSYAIEGVGMLSRNPEADTDFAPLFEPFDNGAANLPYAFFSDVVVATATEVETPRTLQPPTVYREPRVPVFVKIAASVALLLGVGFMFNLKVLPEPTLTSDMASLAPATASASTLVTDNVMEAQELYIAMPQLQDKAPVEAAVETAEPPEAAETVVQPKEDASAHTMAVADIPADNDQLYYIIVASYKTNRQAKKHIAEAANRGQHILMSDGKYRIYVASTESKTEAENLKARYGVKFTGAWIYSAADKH